MPILVVCPACKSEFKVSDKFAGKQGPCPKCKAPIKVPDAPAAAGAPAPEVKIHAPDEPAAKGAKAGTARAALKPITREETKLGRGRLAAIVVAVAACLAAAWFAAPVWQSSVVLRGLALVVISIPTAAAGYSFLRNDELEPYRGQSLWLRSTICGLVYTALWCGFYYIPPDMTRTTFNWFFLAPPFLLIGAGTAFACYDLDFGSGFFHYCFYLVVSLILGAAAGVSMPWAGMSMG